MIEIVQEDICLAQHDVTNAVGPFERCVAMLEYAIRSGHEYGLNIQPSKTAILLCSRNSHEEALEHLNIYKSILKVRALITH